MSRFAQGSLVVAIVLGSGCAGREASKPNGPISGDPVSLPTGLERIELADGDAAEGEGERIDPVAMYPYPLDDVGRNIPPTGRVTCPDVELVTYRGDIIRYHKPVKVYVGFRDRLRLFEEVVRDTAIEVYGRAPRRIRHMGSFYCRRIRAWPTYVSEHGLGNAIDVEGFDFDWVSRKQAPDVPNRLRQGHKVRLDKHWDATRGVGAVHARFLRLLAERVSERYDIFRVMLGPAEDGHDNHFHFDCAPWRSVTIFEDDVLIEEAGEDGVVEEPTF